MANLWRNLSILEDKLSHLILNGSEMEGGRYLLRAVFQDWSHFEVNLFGLGYEQEVTSVYLWNIKISGTEISEEVENVIAHGYC